MATTSPASQTYGPTLFADSVLRGIGAPVTQTNRSLIYAWMRGEGTRAANNPLATTQDAPGATDFNSIGVKNYPTFQEGVQATVRTLLNGRYNGIVNDLRVGNVDPYNIVQRNAQEFDTWGTGAGLVGQLVGGPPPGNVSPWQVGKNWSAGANDIKQAALKPLQGIEKDILYGLAFLAGTLLVITGFLLIGADIGIAAFGKRKSVQVVQRVYKRNSSSGDEYDKAGREHAQHLRREARRQGRHPVKRQEKHEEPKRKSTPGPNQRRLQKSKSESSEEEIPF